MRPIKVLSLMQPWASLWLEPKRIETRSWYTSYRGLLAIHASKRFAREDMELSLQPPFNTALASLGYTKLKDLPLGAIIGVTTLEHVGRIIAERETGEPQVCGASNAWVIPVTGDEFTFGNYEPGRYGWVRGDVYRLPEPIPAKGSLGLWTPDPDVQERLQTFAQEVGLA